jgi:hypothetical protein
MNSWGFLSIPAFPTKPSTEFLENPVNGRVGQSRTLLRNKERIGLWIRVVAIPQIGILAKHFSCGTVNWDEAGFVEFGFTDRKHSLIEIHIITVHLQRFG